MLGWHLRRASEIQLEKQLFEQELKALVKELAAAKEYAAKCERLLEHERARIDAERERADRIADSLFQSQGLPATSTTVVSEQKKQTADFVDKVQDFQKQLGEIYGETMDEMVMDGAEALPEELVEAK